MSKSASYRFVLAAAAMALLAADVGEAFARGGRGGGGGGMRGGGGGGGMRGGGVRSGGSMSMSRPSGGGGFGGGSSRASAGTLPSGARPGGGGRGSGSRPGGDGIGGNRPGGGDGIGGDRPGGGNRPGGDNNFNRNTNINNNVNVGDGWGGWDDGIHHPIAAGIAIGAVAAAAYGSWYYALPSGCYPYGYGSYYNCGGAYLEPRYEGDTVVYVTVPDPKETASGGTSAGAPTGAPAHTTTPGAHVVTPPPSAPKGP